ILRNLASDSKPASRDSKTWSQEPENCVPDSKLFQIPKSSSRPEIKFQVQGLLQIRKPAEIQTSAPRFEIPASVISCTVLRLTSEPTCSRFPNSVLYKSAPDSKSVPDYPTVSRFETRFRRFCNI
ncbi:hypothetical protein AVEN_174327-1, partial [Araneus ventricosus]